MKFRRSRGPLSSLWRLGDQSCYGSVRWYDLRPYLELMFETDVPRELGRISHLDHPLLRATKPPLQPTVSADIPGIGVVTLERCAQLGISAGTNYRTRRSLIRLRLQPTRIWLGSAFEQVGGTVSEIEAYDGRLGGFFGRPGFASHHAYSGEQADVFAALGGPSSVWAFYVDASPAVALGDTGYTLQVGTSGSEGGSSTEGERRQTITCIRIRAPEPVAVEKIRDVAGKIEQLLSVFSLEPFAFQVCVCRSHSGDYAALAWEIGDEAGGFVVPMRHQIMFDFSDPAELARIVDQWFRASRIEELSRWIFCRALSEASDGVTRFIAVAQAFEVLGRELGPSKRIEKSQMKRAADAVRVALSNAHLPPEFVERSVKLIQSSNRDSYQDVLKCMMDRGAAQLSLGDTPELEAFCKLVAETRNSIVHMTNKNERELDQAFARVNKLSLRLCFWYAVVQAGAMAVRPRNIGEFLFNNRNARHGLPNDLLERM